jgi:SAM-dependent methyltransferase/uncharacterized protein YbaR (Trm112 family)
VKSSHFDALRPICPVCRAGGASAASPLVLAAVPGEDDVIEGMLHCSNTACRREYPIIDGIPLLVADLRTFVRDQLPAILARDDLSEATETLLGDCCGPGSTFDATRQQLSSYAWDHYAAGDPDEPESREPGCLSDQAATGGVRPGSADRLLRQGIEMIGARPAGPVLELGCSVGGCIGTLEEATGELVLGVDLNYAMLRTAADVLRGRSVRYPRRRVGLVYDRREFATRRPKRADVWACDAEDMPLADASVSLVACLNLLDSVRSPLALLASIRRLLVPGGFAILGCPYDWTASVTAPEQWIGGHSQRGPGRGASDATLRDLLTPGAHPASLDGLDLYAERDDALWHVRLHQRSTIVYRVHLLVVRAS